MVLPQGTIPRGRDFFDPVLRGKTGVARPPTVRVRAGAPIVLGLGAPKADTPVVMAATSALLPREGRARRQPSAGELARTYPPGRGLP
jgi:putative phosphoserine phosphatase/1-acylglycerol-3-phosphate O-acyltransferase